MAITLVACGTETQPVDSGVTDTGLADAGTDAGFDGGVCTEADGATPVPMTKDTTFVKGPYLMYTDGTSIVVKWESATKTASVVEYGPTDALGLKATGDDAVIHMVTLTGLKPGTGYYYRAGDGTVMSMIFQAHTAAAPGTPFRFAAYADSQAHPEIHSQIVAEAAAFGPSFIVHAGDEVSTGSDPTQWQTLLFDVIRPLAHRVPYFVSIGNHEAQSHYFYDYVWYPAPKGVEAPSSYYTFTWGDVFFIVFDSTKFVLGTYDSQYEWAVKQLATKEARSAKWRVAVWHEVAYTEAWGNCDYTGEERFRETLIPMLEKYKVQMIINGHTHDYQRGILNGVYHVICGGGGGDLETLHCTTFPWVNVEKFVHNHLEVEVGCSEMKVSGIELGGAVIDTFSIPANPLK
jgi:UDP-2,3-diacylglucosamine pyrophosphatase LpxH